MKERFKTPSAVFLLLMRNNNGYFRAVKWSGEPEIKEPNKNDELKCFLFSFNISNNLFI